MEGPRTQVVISPSKPDPREGTRWVRWRPDSDPLDFLSPWSEVDEIVLEGFLHTIREYKDFLNWINTSITKLRIGGRLTLIIPDPRQTGIYFRNLMACRIITEESLDPWRIDVQIDESERSYMELRPLVREDWKIIEGPSRYLLIYRKVS